MYLQLLIPSEVMRVSHKVIHTAKTLCGKIGYNHNHKDILGVSIYSYVHLVVFVYICF